MQQSEIIFSVQESPEGGYEARALGHSIFSQADSLDELKSMLCDAVACHLAELEKPTEPSAIKSSRPTTVSSFQEQTEQISSKSPCPTFLQF